MYISICLVNQILIKTNIWTDMKEVRWDMTLCTKCEAQKFTAPKRKKNWQIFHFKSSHRHIYIYKYFIMELRTFKFLFFVILISKLGIIFLFIAQVFHAKVLMDPI